MKKRADYSPCGDLLRSILSKDGWTLRGVSQPLADAPDAVFVAQKQGRRIAFFFSDQAANKLTRAFKRIRQADRGTFKLFGVLITPTTAEMQRLRHGDQADKYPRAFFASLEEIREAAAGGAPVEHERAGGIMSFKAEVLANTPLGGLHSAHYRLVFKAPFLQEVRPPQFIMMDTMPARVPLGARSVRWGNLRGAVNLAPRPLLKRPFGICRDFHPHFASDYLKHLRLPPVLALVLHPVLPDHFDVLYKVLPDGVGTALMTKLKRRQKVRMLGPLGRPFDVRRLRADGVEEVHVIGGGVGMAPLILLVEALRYYSFQVKMFLGIAGLESLRYRDELAATFGEKPRDAYIYIDDLLATGVPGADIYVACDSEVPSRSGGIVRGIPKENLFHGLVPEQYRQYLERNPPHLNPLPRMTGERRVPSPLEHKGEGQGEGSAHHGSVVAFTCGPNRMIEVVAEIAQRASIPLKVLLEKRMGCGIGVCFSCVCKVRRANGTEDYARVCTEGPLFDASDILWKNDGPMTSGNPPHLRVRVLPAKHRQEPKILQKPEHMEERRLETNIGKLLLRSPLLTASGTSGSADELGGLRQSKATIQALGGFVTKGVTLEPRKGNPEPRVIETRAGLLNSIGLQNKGADRFLREDLPKLRHYGLPVIVNISANTVEEYGQLAARLLENDDGQIASLEINVSCPNIKEGGVSFGVDPCSVERIVSVVKKAVPRGREVTIITKMTPNITDVTVPANAAIAGGTDALSVINTLRGVAIDIKAQKPYFANVSAGLSGPAIKPIGLCMVWDCFEKIPECRSGKVPIIGIGGISTWEDVVEYILAGSTAVGVGTAWFVYPQVFVEMHKGLVKYLTQHDTTVRKLIGKVHEAATK